MLIADWLWLGCVIKSLHSMDVHYERFYGGGRIIGIWINWRVCTCKLRLIPNSDSSYLSLSLALAIATNGSYPYLVTAKQYISPIDLWIYHKSSNNSPVFWSFNRKSHVHFVILWEACQCSCVCCLYFERSYFHACTIVKWSSGRIIMNWSWITISRRKV